MQPSKYCRIGKLRDNPLATLCLISSSFSPRVESQTFVHRAASVSLGSNLSLAADAPGKMQGGGYERPLSSECLFWFAGAAKGRLPPSVSVLTPSTRTALSHHLPKYGSQRCSFPEADIDQLFACGIYVLI